MAVCVSCEHEAKTTRRGLCGACYKRWRKWNKAPNVTCEWCGRGYFDSVPRKHTLCSLTCYRAWKIGRDSRNEMIAGHLRPPVDPDGWVELACEHCGSPFRVRPYELRRRPKYCSRACKGARRTALRVLVTCEHCGTVLRRPADSVADVRL
jgi:hypothetical protein